MSKEKLRKTDAVDCNKLARELAPVHWKEYMFRERKPWKCAL